MLPYANATPRYTDLTENAIEVVGENDNVFNSNDYVLFYAEEQTKWIYNTTDKKFHHTLNRYADTTYYFITTELGQGKRITQQSSSTLLATKTVRTFDDYAFHETDAINLIKSGREWFGEVFDLTTAYNFSFTFPNIDVSSPVYVNTSIAARASSTSTFTVTSGTATTSLYPSSIDITCYYCDYASLVNENFNFLPSNSAIPIKISKITPAAIGWLNYIELNARRELKMSGNQLLFRDMNSVAQGNISTFNLISAIPIKIWETTNPLNVKNQSVTLINNNYEFTLATDSLRSFIAFTANNYLTPTALGIIQNQNIHALGQADLIIISHPDFLNQATTLANFHRNTDGLSVITVTPQQIYNEYSSGAQDISAIRDFVKTFFDRALLSGSGFPKYLLLFGDGSYNNKTTGSGNTNFIPTYQSENSTSFTSSYVSDDFYGLLNDNEGEWSPYASDLVDIGIGRLPVKTVTEAEDAVNKIMKYSSLESFGNWRNTVCFIADDEDGSVHISQANQLATMVDTTYKNYTIDKIYLDAYPQQTTPGGQRYPEVNTAITKRVEKGALIVNYTGHGGEIGLAHERILEVSQINEWGNSNNLPLFVTATCEFSRFDDPARTSAGEDIFLNPKGGGIALLTTVRLVYSSPNFYLNQNFYKIAFKPLSNGEMPRLGDLFRLTKVASGPSVNNRNFTLLGDPALRLAYPEQTVYTTSINKKNIDMLSPDTLKALSSVTISGYIGNKGAKIDTYNGTLYATIFDKAQSFTTLSNDGIDNSPPIIFTLQKNILYNGKVSVSNGNFSFSFIVPKDIAYQYGIGKISYYATNNKNDANGYYTNLLIGGTANNSANDITGPDIKLYMNYTKFIKGGITNEHPNLLVIVNDSNGINTVGNGIGHDISAILDENSSKAIILNDYYQADLNSYQKGKITYPLANLTEGKHTLQLKVWDVYNNSSQDYTEFIVAQSAKIALSHVLNYPNPFTTKTKFLFEHNQANSQLEVQIQIFTVTGKLVKTINALVYSDGFRADAINWDGTDDFGDKIAKGIYIYKIKVHAPNGTTTDKIEKLVILN